MLKFQPEQYRTGSVGPHIGVDLDDEFGYVNLVVEAQEAETFDDRDIARSMSGDEARMLAAALIHFADESDRLYRR